MDKEKIITIVIGLLVGVTIAAAYFAIIKFYPQFPKNLPKIAFDKSPKTTEPAASPSAKIAPTTPLAVTEPADETAVKESPITVSGKTNPSTRIFIYANSDEKTASSDATGNFSTTIKLEEGENTLSFTTISDTGKIETVLRNVILEIKP